MKEWKAVRQSNEPYQEVVIHGCDFNITDSELFAALRRVNDLIKNRKMQILLMQVSVEIKILDSQRGLVLLLLVHCKSKLLLLQQSAKEFIEKTSGLLRLGESVLRMEYRKNTSWICEVCGHLK